MVSLRFLALILPLALMACRASSGDVLTIAVPRSPTVPEIDSTLITTGLVPLSYSRLSDVEQQRVGADTATERLYEKHDDPSKSRVVAIYTFSEDSQARRDALRRWEAVVTSGSCCDVVKMDLTVVLITGNEAFRDQVKHALRSLAL